MIYSADYQRRYRAKVKARKELEAEGFNVMEGGYKMTTCDLIAINRYRVRLIAVELKEKNSVQKVFVGSEVLKWLPVPPRVSKEVWFWRSGLGWEKIIN